MKILFQMAKYFFMVLLTLDIVLVFLYFIFLPKLKSLLDSFPEEKKSIQKIGTIGNAFTFNSFKFLKWLGTKNESYDINDKKTKRLYSILTYSILVTTGTICLLIMVGFVALFSYGKPLVIKV